MRARTREEARRGVNFITADQRGWHGWEIGSQQLALGIWPLSASAAKNIHGTDDSLCDFGADPRSSAEKKLPRKQLQQFFFADYAHAQLARLVELRAGVGAGHNIVGLF